MEFISSGFEKIISPQNQYSYTGKERKIKLSKNIVLFKDNYGSHRFIIYINNIPVSGLQIMHSNKIVPIVANVFTLEKERQKGYAKELFKEAKKYFNCNIKHSSDLSPLGKVFANKVN